MRAYVSLLVPTPALRASRALLTAVALAAALGAGCAPQSFTCSTNADCVSGAARGICEASSACSFADSACTESGRRYDATAPTELAGECVAATSTCIRALALGAHHTCASLGGAVSCWGSNDGGQRGDATRPSGTAPTAVAGLPAVVALSAGASHTCALTAAGKVWCWGANDAGQLGGAGGPAAAEVAGLPEASAVQAGGRHTCALTKAGEVFCWGSNDDGQLGDGTTTASGAPRKVSSDVVALAAGERHTCAVRRDGAIACWGLNDWGQCGLGPSVYRALAPTAAAAMGDLGADHIVAGSAHTCVLRGDKTWCWGQVGNGVIDRSTGVLPGSTASHGCSRTERHGGELWCWGANQFGQLGTGATADEVAAPAPATLVTVGDLAAVGATHSCAVTRDGALWCWGANAAGQLGVDTGGKTARDPRPVVVCK